jgi:hypothetical protein
MALEMLGAEAKPAFPAVLQFINTTTNSADKKSYAIRALKAIDPEAAAKAGVK